METFPNCTVSSSRGRFDSLWLTLLALATLLVHGYHPWAEDGGLYIAGVEYLLDRSLFPRETAFVTEHLRFSAFAPTVAATVRLSHLSLAFVLFCTYLLSTALMLYAGLRLARQCFASQTAPWGAVALLAAWWTLPVAGTSLLLMDPYVTARSLSTPLCLLAVAAALERWSPASGRSKPGPAFLRSPASLCLTSLLAAAVFHPLMTIYALGLTVAVRLEVCRVRRRWTGFLAAVVLLSAGVLQVLAHPDTAPATAAAVSRYYWFLSQWQWFEWLGLIGPLLLFSALLRWLSVTGSPGLRRICRAAIPLGLLSWLTAATLAQEHFQAHTVARLQPLRAFLLLYALMILLLGGRLVQAAEMLQQRIAATRYQLLIRLTPALFTLSMALVMFLVQRDTFPASIHLELPGRRNPNGWVQAFLWAREHTPREALFALDARYVNTDGEDAQTFRALAERSALPDYSKDGGEAAITPALAPEWQEAATATGELSRLTDDERDRRLRPFGVQWVVLHAEALTAHPCPFRNNVVKVCALH